MSYRRRLGDLVAPRKEVVGGTVERQVGAPSRREVFATTAPKIGGRRVLPDALVVEGSVKVVPSVGGLPYAAGLDYAEDAPNKVVNLAIPAATPIRVSYFADDEDEEAAPPELPPLSSDPPYPEGGEAWLRIDKDPPEIRVMRGGATYAIALAPVAAEVAEPLFPDVGLFPPLLPEGSE